MQLLARRQKTGGLSLSSFSQLLRPSELQGFVCFCSICSNLTEEDFSDRFLTLEVLGDLVPYPAVNSSCVAWRSGTFFISLLPACSFLYLLFFWCCCAFLFCVLCALCSMLYCLGWFIAARKAYVQGLPIRTRTKTKTSCLP